MHIKCQQWRQEGDADSNQWDFCTNQKFISCSIVNGLCSVIIYNIQAFWMVISISKPAIVCAFSHELSDNWYNSRALMECLIQNWFKSDGINKMPIKKLNEEALPYKEIIFVGFHFKMLVLLNCFYFGWSMETSFWLKYGNGA